MNISDYQCIICSGDPIAPKRCLQCNKYYCAECLKQFFEKQKNNNPNDAFFCCFCRHKDPKLFKDDNECLQKLSVLKEKLKNSLKCERCMKIFDAKDSLKEHQKQCVFLCSLCSNTFTLKNKFFQHIDRDKDQRAKILEMFNSRRKDEIQQGIKAINNININDNEKNNNASQILKKSNVALMNPNVCSKYESFLGEKKSDLAKKKKIPSEFEGCKYNDEYDMFYCEGANVANKTCKPGELLCKNCMQANKTYHLIPKHYLINKVNRLCKYKQKKYFCNVKFICVSKIGNTQYQNEETCGSFEALCEPCKEIYKLMDKYLSQDTIALMHKTKD